MCIRDSYVDSFKEMTKIVDAIQARNPEAAHEACVEHIKAASRVALAALAEKQGKTVDPITPPLNTAQSLR